MPCRTIAAICLAINATTSGSTPSPVPPDSASPDSFSSTRLQVGAGAGPPSSRTDAAVSISVTAGLLAGCPRVRAAVPFLGPPAVPGPPAASGLADLEPGEPGHRHAGLVQHLPHGALGVLHERLLEEHRLLVERVDPAVDDPRQGRLRLALLARRRLGDPPLPLDHVGRD